MKIPKWILSPILFIFLMAVSLVIPASLLAASPEAAVYQPQIVYNGDYHPTTIYYQSPGSSFWKRMSKSDNYLNVVRCPAALKALNSVGQWHGHIKADGSCGSPYEPSLYAVGNRINYDQSMAGE